MKKVALFILSILYSCGICDPETDSGQHADLAGKYVMSAWNAPVPTDLDQNGTASRNLMAETHCYDHSHLILSEDMTYAKSYHFAETMGEMLSCDTEATTGSWSANGNVVRLVSSTGDEVVLDYGVVNKILTRSEANWNFPVSNGNLVSVDNGPVNMVFEKLE